MDAPRSGHSSSNASSQRRSALCERAMLLASPVRCDFFFKCLLWYWQVLDCWFLSYHGWKLLLCLHVFALCPLSSFSFMIVIFYFFCHDIFLLVLLRPLPSPPILIASSLWRRPGGHGKSLVPLRSDAPGEASEGWTRHGRFVR